MKQTQVKIIGEDNYAIQESFKVLRSNIQFCGKDMKVIALTSYGENEGKTEVSFGLARSLADLKKKVLIIDADMRKSRVAGRQTDIVDGFGLSELISGQQSFEDCIYTTQYPELQLIVSGQYPPNPVELLNSKQFKLLIDKMKEYYDYIIIDTPPVGLVIDAAVISQVSDGVLIVIGNENVKRSQEKEVINQLKKANANILGAVKNMTRRQSQRYQYR